MPLLISSIRRSSVRRVLVLDDRRNLPVSPDDPAVSVRLGDTRRQNRRGRAVALMRAAPVRQGSRRRSSGTSPDSSSSVPARAFELGLGLQERVSGTQLRLLQSKPKAGPIGERPPNGLGLVTDDNDGVYRRDGSAARRTCSISGNPPTR